MQFKIKILTFAFLLLGLFACSSGGKNLPSVGTFGNKITPAGAISMNDLSTQMRGKQEIKTKVEAPIEAVCQKKGCWMTLKKNTNEGMRVTFKDYGFFVPLDATGKTAIVEGTARFDTTSVADLRHYAEDEGLSKAEIDKITEPEIEMVFVADGVIIK